MQSKIPWLKGKRTPLIAVVGDVILDEYLEGQVHRISPEAPVPVHLVTRTYQVPGGAANTARNIKKAGGSVALLSVVGDDEAGRQLRSLLVQDGIDVDHLITVTDRPTIRKTRITASSHQIVRVDWEQGHPITQVAQERLVEGLDSLDFDGLLISDYGKGALTGDLLKRLIGLARSRGVPVVVDPKGRDYSRYQHATLITPNRKEACDALNLDPLDDHDPEVLGRDLQRVFGLQHILVTLGAKGMLYVPDLAASDQKVVALPAIAREVYDVSGAGDTVVAIMALGAASGASMIESMRLANTAAAIVVGKWGTQPIELQELEVALTLRPEATQIFGGTASKVVGTDGLQAELAQARARSHKIVFTNGCFDLLHAGHVTYLEEARMLGDLLVVGVNSDQSVAALKGSGRPLVPLEQRMRTLAALACVDYVVAFEQETPLDLIKVVHPDVLVKGGDYQKDAPIGSKTAIVGQDVVESYGGRVETIVLVPGLSTTGIVNRIVQRPG